MKFAMCVKNIDVKLPIVPKLKLLGNSKFNHLTIILRLPLTCRPKFPPISGGPTSGNLTC